MDTNNEQDRPTRRLQRYRNASDQPSTPRRRHVSDETEFRRNRQSDNPSKTEKSGRNTVRNTSSKQRRPLTHEEKVRLANNKKIKAEKQRQADYAKAREDADSAAQRRKERQRLAAQRRKRQLMIRLALLAAAVFLAIFGIIAFQNLKKKKSLEPEGGAGTNILAAAEAANQTENADSVNSNLDTSPEGLPKTDDPNMAQDQNLTDAADNDTLSICMVGDIVLHQSILDAYNKGDHYDFSNLFANVALQLQKYDLKIASQESIMAGPDLGYTGFPDFNSPYEVADALTGAGFNVVLQATEHALDQGPEGIASDLDYWNNSHPDTAVLGIHDQSKASKNIYVFEKNGIRVAVLNYTINTNHYQEEVYSGKYLDRIDLMVADKVYEDVQKAKAIANYVIVCPHWGNENELSPTDEQHNWTQYFLDWGVDLVIGTHPHVIQPVEVMTRSDGHRMLVYYSIGNFISNQEEAIGNVGAMAQIVLRKNPDGTVNLDNYGIETLVAHENPNQTGYTTYILDEYPDDLAANSGVFLTDSNFSKAWCYQLRDSILGDFGSIELE